jgi:hypothetical protein
MHLLLHICLYVLCWLLRRCPCTTGSMACFLTECCYCCCCCCCVLSTHVWCQACRSQAPGSCGRQEGRLVRLQSAKVCARQRGRCRHRLRAGAAAGHSQRGAAYNHRGEAVTLHNQLVFMMLWGALGGQVTWCSMLLLSNLNQNHGPPITVELLFFPIVLIIVASALKVPCIAACADATCC